MAYQALEREDFFAASARIADGLRALIRRAGAEAKFNATITHAFMALIAERMATAEPERDFEGFLATNFDLLDGSALNRLYAGERLADPRARWIALLPDLPG